jgi:formate hydrogenlyase transcriptional activator
MKPRKPLPTDAAEMLRIISEGTASTIGQDFFKTLAKLVIQSLDIRYAIITECANEEKNRVKTLVYIERNKFLENFEYDLDGTPCEIVMTGQSYFCTTDLDKLFPREEGVKAYFAVPIFLRDGEVAGHLAVFDKKSLEIGPEKLNLLKIFASRVGAEFERQRKDAIIQSNMERYKNIFDFSPVGMCEEDFSDVKKQIEYLKKKYKMDLKSIFDLYPDQILECWKLVKRIRVNRSQLDVFDVKREKDYAQYMQDSYMPQPARGLLLKFESGVTEFEVETEIVSKAGKRKMLRVKRVIIPGAEKDWSKSLISCVDITELKKTQQDLQQSLAEVQSLKEKLEAENTYLQQEIKLNNNFEEIVSTSQAFRKVLEKVEQVANTSATVLILGESGTGKELIARAIHSVSTRCKRPLVKVNCAALPANLIESELFGHEKGAFTGAVAQKIGRFELANSGTLFLDEIGDLPIELQAKLLRALQEGEFERLGSTKTIKVDVRVIAATNRDLKTSVSEKEFRADLYYRLNVFPIHCPPLRERKEDIPYLVNHFCKKYGAKFSKKVKGISKSALETIMHYDWPGNVRELENIIERGVIVSNGNALESGEWLPSPSITSIPSTKKNDAKHQSAQSIQDVERQHIESVLIKTNWKIRGDNGAAKILNLNPTTLEARMKKLGISRQK